MKYGGMPSRVDILISRMIKAMASQVRVQQSFIVCEHADIRVSLSKGRKVRIGQVGEHARFVAWPAWMAERRKAIFRVRREQPKAGGGLRRETILTCTTSRKSRRVGRRDFGRLIRRAGMSKRR